FHARAVDYGVALALAALFIDYQNGAGAVHHHVVATLVADRRQIRELHESIVLGVQRGLLGNSAGGAADMERAHRQLRSRLADRLRRDHPYRFAHFHQLAGGQVTAVAHDANTPLRLARQYGANLHALKTRLLDGIRQVLRNLLVDVDDHGAFVVL